MGLGWSGTFLLLKFLLALDLEAATEKLLGSLLGVVHELIGTVAAIPPLSLGFLCHRHAEI